MALLRRAVETGIARHGSACESDHLAVDPPCGRWCRLDRRRG